MRLRQLIKLYSLFFLLVISLFAVNAFAFPPTQCSDGIDNDGDGKIDTEDTDCSNSLDDDEGCTVEDKEPNGWYDSATEGANLNCAILTFKGVVTQRDEDFFKLSGGANRRGALDGKRNQVFSVEQGNVGRPIIYYALHNPGANYGYFQFATNYTLSSNVAQVNVLEFRPPDLRTESRTGYLIFDNDNPNTSNNYVVRLTTKGKEPRTRQYLYVKFEDFRLSDLHESYASFDVEQFKDSVVDQIKKHFENAGFGSTQYVITTAEPNVPEYSTLTFGTHDLTAKADYTNTEFSCNSFPGQSEFVDVWDYNPRGQALVCLNNINNVTFENMSQLVKFSAKLGSHEIGHLIGMQHTNDSHSQQFLPNNNNIMEVSPVIQFAHEYVFDTALMEFVPWQGINFNGQRFRFVQNPNDVLRILQTQDA